MRKLTRGARSRIELSRRWGCACLLALIAVLPVSAADLTITWPVTRTVFQRDTENHGLIQFSGECPADAASIEGRTVVRQGGATVPWAVIDPHPKEGHFSGALPATGGWYDVEVRSVGGAESHSAKVERVGVGEVFIVVGHSVAAGQDLNLDGSADDRVITVALGPKDEGPHAYWRTGAAEDLPEPGFVQFASGVRPAPFGGGAYFWATFAERVARREEVPVLIFNAAFGGTSLEHWAKSAVGVPFEHSFVKSAIRMPYINLRNTILKYTARTGLRAILADQGQNDWPQPDENVIFEYYCTWVAQARQDANFPELAIVVNRQTPFLRDRAVRRAQERMIALPHCFPGPDYDSMVPADRPDSIHLGKSGMAKAAEWWAAALDADFFRKATPCLPSGRVRSR